MAILGPAGNPTFSGPPTGPTMRQRVQAEPDWEHFETRLRGGISPWTMAKELVARPHLADINMKSLEKLLDRMRGSMARSGAPSVFGSKKSLLPLQFKHAVEKLQGVPDVKRLAKLVYDQEARVTSGIKFEKKLRSEGGEIGMLVPGMREEIEILWKMQLSLIEVKQKLGLLHREPMRMEGLLGVVMGSLGGGTPGGPDGNDGGPKTLDSAARQRVLQAVKKVRRMFPLPKEEKG